MSRPTLIVRVAFAAAPFDPIAGLVWTDISAYVWLDDNPGGAAISITRGRQFELDKIQAGTLTLVLDNRDRRFDPDNVASPYASQVIPTKRINVRATFNSITYDLFTGYVESWVPIDGDPGGVSVNVVRLTAVDLLKTLNYTTVTQLENSSNSAAQVISDILNTAGWPAADRITGATATSTQIPAQTWGPAPALTSIQTIATADGGSFFLEDDGRTAYHDRYWAVRNSTAQALFGDRSSMSSTTLAGAHNASVTTIAVTSNAGFPSVGTVLIDSEWIAYTSLGANQLLGATRGAYGSTAASHSNLATVASGELPYQDVQFSFDDTRLINHAEVTRAGGTLQSWDDTGGSQTTYGLRGVQITGLQITTDAEALSRAQYLVALYAQPYLRVQSLILNGDLAPTTAWPQILARTFDDKITVVRRPPGGGTAIAKFARIQAMNQAIGRVQWLTTWQLSPVGNDVWFILDSTTSGILDTNRLGY